MRNVNAANLPGVLWYLHNEVVERTPRKFGITSLGSLGISSFAELLGFTTFTSSVASKFSKTPHHTWSLVVEIAFQSAAQENHSTEGKLWARFGQDLGLTWVRVTSMFCPYLEGKRWALHHEISMDVTCFQVQTRAPQTLWEKGMNFGVRVLLWIVGFQVLQIWYGSVWIILDLFNLEYLDPGDPDRSSFTLRICIWQRTSNWTLWMWSWQVRPETLSRSGMWWKYVQS